MLRKAMSALALISIVAGPLPAVADTLVIDGVSPSDAAGQPRRGETKAEVEAEFGAPVAMTAAVGEPPISSWDYGPFVVYFEYDYVLHTVAKR